MENCSRGQYESIKKALKRVGFKVGEVVKQGKKTVITVFRYEASEKVVMETEKRSSNSE